MISRSISAMASLSMLGVLALSSLAAGPVQARTIGAGGTNLTAAQILQRSAKAMAGVTSIHTKGAVKAEVATQTNQPGNGAIIWAFFRGDLSAKNDFPQAHIRGQVRVGQSGANPKDAQGHSFKLAIVGPKAGVKLGMQKWVCGNVSDLTNLNGLSLTAVNGARKAVQDAVGAKTLNVVEPASLLKVRVPQAGIVNLGPTTFRGIPVWHLQLKEKQSVVVDKQRVTVHMTANLWISQMDYTLRRITASLKEGVGPVSASFAMWEVFSRFNESVPIYLPPACSAM